MTSGERKDRALNGLLAFVAVLTAGSVIMLVIALPRIFSADNNADEVRRGNELTTCRGVYRADIDDADAELSAAKARLLIADSDQLVLLPEGLAAALDDPGDVGPVLERSIAGQAVIEEAQADVTAAVDQLGAATTAYRAALDASRLDPEAFLAECREDDD